MASLWPTVARNISVGALLFFDVHRCNNTCIFSFQTEENPPFSLQHEYLCFRVAFSVQRIPCILLHHSSYHSPPEFIGIKTQNLVCDSSASFLDYQRNLPEFADFTAHSRKSQIFSQLKCFVQRISISTCAKNTVYIGDLRKVVVLQQNCFKMNGFRTEQ